MNLRFAITACSLATAVCAAHAQDNKDTKPAPKPAGPHPVQRVMPKEPVKDKSFRGSEAHVYFKEKELTWKIGNDVIERDIQFDKDSGSLRTIAIKTMGGVPKINSVSTTEGEFSVIGSDGQKRGPYRLDKDWAYIWQSVATPPHAGRLLTIHLQGVRSNAGLEVEVLYEVYPGNRPYLAKSITLINRAEAPVSLTDLVYDRWILPKPDHVAKGVKTVAAGKPEDFSASGDFSLGIEDKANRIGFRAFIPGKQGEIAYQDGTIVPKVVGPIQAEKRGGRAFTPFAVIFAYTGSQDRGNELYQKYDSSKVPTEKYIKSTQP